MAVIRNARINLAIRANENLNEGERSIPSRVLIDEAARLSSGNGVGQIDAVYYERLTGVGASVKSAFTLTGALSDRFGNNIDFAEVISITIVNQSDTTGNSLFLGANDNFGVHSGGLGFWELAGHRCVIPPGGWVSLYNPDGVPVVASTGDGLEVETNSASSGNAFDILILGRS